MYSYLTWELCLAGHCQGQHTPPRCSHKICMPAREAQQGGVKRQDLPRRCVLEVQPVFPLGRSTRPTL